jgi:hypothetical protein
MTTDSSAAVPFARADSWSLVTPPVITPIRADGLIPNVVGTPEHAVLSACADQTRRKFDQKVRWFM